MNKVEGNSKMDIVAYLLDEDDMRKLRIIQHQLHGGTDRERDYGHRLWLLLDRAIPIREGEKLEFPKEEKK
jgi:hypothetical protein